MTVQLGVEAREREKREKDERRASRALKRLSASSTNSSLAAASTAYSSNLKLGKSPSIGQVLDRNSAAGMDEVLKKLRSFGGT